MNKIFSFLLVVTLASVILVPTVPVHAAIGFVQEGASSDTPGLISGLWHGMIAPYALIVSIFTEVGIYAHPNAGWIYNAGFLLGIIGSLPGGWILAIISLIMLIV